LDKNFHVSSFSDSELTFDTMISDMEKKNELLASATSGELFVEDRGREVLRTVFQNFISSKGKGDVGPAILNGENEVLQYKRSRTRKLMTLFGKISIERIGYSGPELSMVFPLDATLNLCPTLYSYVLQQRVVAEAIRGSYSEASKAIFTNTGNKISPSRIESIVARSAVDFEEFYEQFLDRATLQTASKSPLLVLSLDGKGIVMRKEHLTNATQKKAAESAHKLDKRLCPGEKKNFKRMATVAAVYSIGRNVRTASDIVGNLEKDETKKKKQPRPIGKRVWSSIERDAKNVTKELVDEAKRRDPRLKKEWVVLVDGCPNQMRRIKKELRKHKVSATLIVDFIHALEYLWDAARCFYPATDLLCEQWVKEKMTLLLTGSAGHLAAGLRRSATLKNLSLEDRKDVDKAANYLLKKAPYMKYKSYIERGLPIATGIIEGACRHLINDRIGITGARWSVSGAEGILKFRSLNSSGDFADYWVFHEKREFERNYGSNYWKLPELHGNEEK
jgi:hypothetical protein